MYRLKCERTQSDHNTLLVSITHHQIKKHNKKIKKMETGQHTGMGCYPKRGDTNKKTHDKFQSIMIKAMEKQYINITITTGSNKMKMTTKKHLHLEQIR